MTDPADAQQRRGPARRRHGDAAEARRQSEHLAQVEPPHWSEQLPDWNDWTA